MDAKIYQHLTDLAEPTRTRLLFILEEDGTGVSVGELTKITQLPQSTVSRHLKVLKNGGWLALRSEGPANYFWLNTSALGEEAKSLWQIVRQQLSESPSHREDLERTRLIVANRNASSRSFFGRLGAQWDQVRDQLFGNHHQLPTLLSLFQSDLSVGDIGCGTGENLKTLSTVCKKVIGIDQQAEMLAVAEERIAGLGNVEVRQGSIESLPLCDGELDGCIASLVLHHVSDPQLAFNEVRRVLKAGGRFIVLDMVPHGRKDYQQMMGHCHLGFTEDAIAEWAQASHFSIVRHERLAPDPDAEGPGLQLFVLQAIS